MLVSANPCIEIPKQQKLILAWYAVDGFMQAGVKGLPLLIWVGHGWSIDTDEGQVYFARQDRRRVIMLSEIPLGREVRLEAMSFRMAKPTPETRGSVCGLPLQKKV